MILIILLTAFLITTLISVLLEQEWETEMIKEFIGEKTEFLKFKIE